MFQEDVLIQLVESGRGVIIYWVASERDTAKMKKIPNKTLFQAKLEHKMAAGDVCQLL